MKPRSLSLFLTDWFIARFVILELNHQGTGFPYQKTGIQVQIMKEKKWGNVIGTKLNTNEPQAGWWWDGRHRFLCCIIICLSRKKLPAKKNNCVCVKLKVIYGEEVGFTVIIITGLMNVAWGSHTSNRNPGLSRTHVIDYGSLLKICGARFPPLDRRFFPCECSSITHSHTRMGNKIEVENEYIISPWNMGINRNVSAANVR